MMYGPENFYDDSIGYLLKRKRLVKAEKKPRPILEKPRGPRLSDERKALIAEAVALKGTMSSRAIGAKLGITRNAVIGIWYRANTPYVCRETVCRLMRGPRKFRSYGKPSVIRADPLPKLDGVKSPKRDWWSERYLYEEPFQ